MTYTYRCIGKGTTDSNGVAHITHDCSGNALSDDGYKGVGAGLMDFIASTDAPADISDGSFQSETYEVFDCIYFDGVTSDTSSNYYVNSSYTTIAYSNGYITLTALTSVSGNLYVDLRSLTSSLKGKTVNIEVDCVLNNVETRVRLMKNGSTLKTTEYTSTDGTFTLENVDCTDGTATTYYIRIETRNASANDTIRFKNLKVYPV